MNSLFVLFLQFLKSYQGYLLFSTPGLLLLMFNLFSFFEPSPSCEGPILPWVVYYNNLAPTEAFESYNPIILDSEHHPDLKTLLENKKIVLGYLNLAEAEDRHAWFASIKDSGILIKNNPDWAGSWAVDIRNPLWTELILNKIIPSILSQGFSGLFLDQIDVALDLEKKDPQKYKGMIEASIQLIKAMRKKYPSIYLMLNRGYEILEEVGGDIDFELAETLYTNYDFKTKEYRLRSKQELEWQLAKLNKARFIFPRLTLFSLDYWDPKDLGMIRKIYSMARAQGMRPYVSTPNLDTIYPEPKRS
jgi:polysaccharide biosynthesis protein PelA